MRVAAMTDISRAALSFPSTILSGRALLQLATLLAYRENIEI